MKALKTFLFSVSLVILLGCNIERQMQGTFRQKVSRNSLALESSEIEFSGSHFLLENHNSCLMTTFLGNGNFTIDKSFVTLNFKKSIDDYPDSCLIDTLNTVDNDSFEVRIAVGKNQFEGRKDISLQNLVFIINYRNENEETRKFENPKNLNKEYVYKLPIGLEYYSISVGLNVLRDSEIGAFGYSTFNFNDNLSRQIIIYSVRQSGVEYYKPTNKRKYRIKKTFKGLVLIDSNKQIKLRKLK